MDGDWMELPGEAPRADVAIPPVRYAVPASTMPPLDAGELITHGVPGQWWMLDQAQIVAGPHPGADGETYDIAPLAEWGAARVRPRDQGTPGALSARLLRVRAAELWYYRDGADDSETSSGEPDLAAWYASLSTDHQTPPATRRPQPLRTQATTSGRLVRTLSTTNTWRWMMTVSEPAETPAGIVVHIVSQPEYHALTYRQRDAITPIPVLLHRLWTY